MKKTIYLAGGIATLIGTIAATVTIYAWYTDDTVADIDDVVSVLERLLSEASEANDFAASAEERETINGLLLQLSSEVANLDGRASEEGSYLRVAGGAFALPFGDSADLEVPGEGYSSVGFPGVIKVGTSHIRLMVDGTNHNVTPGDTIMIDAENRCDLLYVRANKPDDNAIESATLRFRCN